VSENPGPAEPPSIYPPPSKALFAVGFGAWDASVIMGAKAFELALDAKY
jgi:hypothetical protein